MLHGEWENVGWRMGKFLVDKHFWGCMCKKKVIGNLAYREMLFYKKPQKNYHNIKMTLIVD